ncbi:MAG: MFS transporter, partial [Alphaproteobacteria bacterium]|nr:MFS transporter [Alphaproteobacteria bacterium]
LTGWQWLFLLEAAPAVLLGIACLIFLTDRPENAKWLAPDERMWLITEMHRACREVESVRSYTLWQSLSNPRVIGLALIYFGIAAASVGLVMFLAQIVKELGLSNLMTGFASAVPYIVGTLGVIVWGQVTDRMVSGAGTASSLASARLPAW